MFIYSVLSCSLSMDVMVFLGMGAVCVYKSHHFRLMCVRADKILEN